MNTPRVVFAGTPDFALASLKALLVAGMAPVAVLTQPDRPAGRGRKLRPSVVKECAIGANIEVLQPKTLKDAAIVQQIADLDADVMIVAAYGLILPQAVLDLPRRGCLNVHASLLPKWRGAAPVQAAVLAGDACTGVSLMQMDAGLDTGAVYVRETLSIGDNETAGSVHDRLAELGGDMLVNHLPAILAGSLTAKAQDDTKATYAGKISAGDAILDWQKPAAELARSVRAYNPVPGARFQFDNEVIKCWQARPSKAEPASPGTVLSAGSEGIEVACAEGSLILVQLQRPGRKRVSAGELAAQLDCVGRQFE